MATQAEHAADLVALKDKLVKIGDETTVLIAKVAALESALAAGGNTTPEVDQAMAAVKAQAGIVDDLVPDEVPPTP